MILKMAYVMKIGVISDTHISDKSRVIPKEILEAFKHVDMVIHAGDLVDMSVLDKLKSICKNVKAVRGNMDPPDVKNKLPEKDIIAVGRHKIGVMHGYGHPGSLVDILKEAFKNDAVDIIVFGHSHMPTNERMGTVLFFNPGSPTDKIFSPYNSYGILEINDEIKGSIIKI